MSAQQSNNRGKLTAKKISIYGILTALCIVFGYLESLVSLDFIAPGVKLGLSNAVALLLITRKDVKGAFAVNTTRIVLCALLFGSPVSLAFSLAGGIASIVFTFLLSKLDCVSVIGISIAGGVIHNIFQLLVAIIIVGIGAVFYIPVLCITGAVSGAVVGILCTVLFSKLNLLK